MNKEQMKKEIYKMVKEKDHVTFAELSRIDGFDGEYSFGLEDLNIFMWFSVSDTASQAITELRDLIKPVPCSWFVYLIDGRIPDVKRARSYRKYKKPRWYPVVFRLAENAPKPEVKYDA